MKKSLFLLLIMTLLISCKNTDTTPYILEQMEFYPLGWNKIIVGKTTEDEMLKYIA